MLEDRPMHGEATERRRLKEAGSRLAWNGHYGEQQRKPMCGAAPSFVVMASLVHDA
jgi:hypothetical protein